MDPALARALQQAPVVLVDGARGTGKTTSARRLARSVVALPRDLPALSADPAAYLSALEPPVLVDEWQLASADLLWTIKEIVDDDPTPGRFLLVGSVEPASYGPTFPLTARAVRLVMRPMSLAELTGRGDRKTFLDRLGDGIPAASAGTGATFDRQLLFRSGFPAARDLPDASLFLDAYAALVSQRAGDEGRDSSRLLRTMRVLATLTGQAVPDQRIWDAADINKVTWKAYEDLLERTHLSVPSPAFESNRLSRLTTYPKRFLADTALALALVGLDAEALTGDPSTAGAFIESFVMQQLRPQVDRLGGALLHLRTSSGEHEVDGILDVGQRVVGIEVKHGARPDARDARHLEWLRERIGERFIAGYVVHTGRDTYPLGERIWAVPLTVVAEPAAD